MLVGFPSLPDDGAGVLLSREAAGMAGTGESLSKLSSRSDVFTHGVIPGSSHAEALGIGSPGIDEAHLMGPCNHGGPQWSTMSDWTCR